MAKKINMDMKKLFKNQINAYFCKAFTKKIKRKQNNGKNV